MRAFKMFLLIVFMFAISAIDSHMKAQLSQTGMGVVAGGGAANPCTGTLDASLGCVMPALGGAP